MKILKKIVPIFLLSFCLIGVNVLAYDPRIDEKYERFVIYTCTQNHYTGTHKKVGTTNWIYVHSIDYFDAEKVRAWSCNSSHDQISGDYIFRKTDQIERMKFTSKGYNKVGKKVCICMDNPDFELSWQEYISFIANYH